MGGSLGSAGNHYNRLTRTVVKKRHLNGETVWTFDRYGFLFLFFGLEVFSNSQPPSFSQLIRNLTFSRFKTFPPSVIFCSGLVFLRLLFRHHLCSHYPKEHIISCHCGIPFSPPLCLQSLINCHPSRERDVILLGKNKHGPPPQRFHPPSCKRRLFQFHGTPGSHHYLQFVCTVPVWKCYVKSLRLNKT